MSPGDAVTECVEYTAEVLEMNIKPKEVRNVRIKWPEGGSIGSWTIPNPDTDPAFIEVAADIGWHICYSICTGSRRVEFLVEEETE